MSLIVRRALYGKLSGDGTLVGLLGTPAPGRSKSIYYDIAPSKAGFPYVIFNKAAGTPSYTFGSLALDNEVWTIKGVDRQENFSATPDPVDAIASRLSALLTDGTISISGKTQLYLRRISDVEYPEPSGDQVFFHAGGEYRLIYT
jgi:hypothetical protein